MNIQLLKYFIHTAYKGNFTKAAQELHIAQPALSKQIARLEKEIGAELFVRTSRGIRLTKAGQMMLYHSERILTDWQKATQSIHELEPEKISVKLATYPTFLWYTLPPILVDFIKSHQDIHLEIEHGLNETIIDWVLGQFLDGGIVIAPVSHPQLKEYPLNIEEFGLLVPTGHPWYGRDEIHFRELHQQPIIISTLNRWYEMFIFPIFKQLNIQPRFNLVVHHYDVIKELVQSGLGISIVPLNAYNWWKKNDPTVDNRLSFICLKPALQRQLIWIERKDKTRSEGCNIFFEYLCKRIE